MREIRCKTYLTGWGGGNPYRGCTHGCIYCDSRSVCYQILEFENIEAKVNAPEVLDAELSKKRKKFVVSTGSMCDPYLPLERELKLTRRILEVVLRRGFGAGVLTKSDLVLRDEDVLTEIHRKYRAVVSVTVTAADDDLCRKIERNVSPTSKRLAALSRYSALGVDTGVWMTPLLPFLTDTEENVRRIVRMSADAGARYIVSFGFGTTMRSGSREYFYSELDKYFPGLKEKYRSAYGDKYECPSPDSGRLAEAFQEECLRRGVLFRGEEIAKFLSEPAKPEQLSLF